MRRFLRSKLTIVALVLTVVTLITGVTWAATSSGPSSQLTSSVVEVVAIPLTVEEGASLQIAGAGFAPDEVVLFELIVGGTGPNIILRSGTANNRGAFLSDNPALAGSVKAGLYTITASTLAGHVASAPLIVVEEAK